MIAMHDMDLRDLFYFEAIATIGHLGRAAERLGRSQPALSKCIDRLESQIGAKLFENFGRGLRLTELGVVLLEQARVMRRTMDESIRRLADHGNGTIGTVRIGVSPVSVVTILPGLLERLLNGCHELMATVITEGSDRLRSALLEQQIDLIIGPIDEGDDEEFVPVPLATDEMIVAARPGHALMGARRTIADLATCRWLLPNETVMSRRWLDRIFKRHQVDGPSVQVESNATLFLMRLVAHTDMLTFISRRDLGLLCEIDVPELLMRRNFGAVHRRGGYLSPQVRRALQILMENPTEIFGTWPAST
jgi:DNA-binding transcriptional LysR family regulator